MEKHLLKISSLVERISTTDFPIEAYVESDGQIKIDYHWTKITYTPEEAVVILEKILESLK